MNRTIDSFSNRMNDEFDKIISLGKKTVHDLHDYIDECADRNEIEEHEYKLLSRLHFCIKIYCINDATNDRMEVTESNKNRVADTISAVIEFTTGKIPFDEFNQKILDLGHNLYGMYDESEGDRFAHTKDGKFFIYREEDPTPPTSKKRRAP